jgi:hypothetical protein
VKSRSDLYLGVKETGEEKKRSQSEGDEHQPRSKTPPFKERIAANMAYQPDTRTRYCNWTFINEKDLPPGQKLFECSRCKEVFYKDRDCQTKHWKFHKPTCKKIEEDSNVIRAEMDLDTCFRTIEVILKMPLQLINGRTLLHAFKCLRKHLSDPSLYETNEEAANIRLRFDRHVTSPLSTVYSRDQSDMLPMSTAFFQRLWSIPGFTSYFLSDEILLTTEMKAKKDRGVALPRKVSYDIENPPQYDPQVHLSDVWWKLFTNFCGNSILLQSSVAVGLREDLLPLATACTRNSMKLFQCPYTRESFPSFNSMPAGIISRSGFFVTMMSPYFGKGRDALASKLWQSNSLGKDEILPGMTQKNFLRLYMEDESVVATVGEDLSYFLLKFWMRTKFMSLDDDEESPGRLQSKSLPPSDRIELLEIWMDWKVPDHMNKLPEELITSDTVRDMMLDILLGNGSKEVFALNDYLDENYSSANSTLPRCAKVIREHRLGIIDVPQVFQYLEIVEPRYIRAMQDQGDKALPFPQEARELIAEFASSSEYRIIRLDTAT